MRGIAIPYDAVTVKDIEFIDMNSSALFFDGDRREIIVFNPNEVLIEELEGRGVKFRWLSDEELKLYSREVILGG